MKLADTNLLLYATDPDSKLHRLARNWLESALSGSETVGFADVVLLAYIRLSTNPLIATVPLSPEEAFDRVDEWLTQAPGTIVHPGARHLHIWRDLLETAGTGGNLTTDAYLAALAIEANATFATFDGDFHRFSGLRLEYLH